MFHATSLRHLILQHISPRTTIFYIWDHITLQSAASAPPFHTTTSRSTRSTSHRRSTSYTIPYPQLFHTTPTFNITPYSTSHYTTPDSTYWVALHHHILILHQRDHHIWRHNTLHHFLHLTSHYNHAAHATIPHHHGHFTSHRNWLSTSCIMATVCVNTGELSEGEINQGAERSIGAHERAENEEMAGIDTEHIRTNNQPSVSFRSPLHSDHKDQQPRRLSSHVSDHVLSKNKQKTITHIHTHAHTNCTHAHTHTHTPCPPSAPPFIIGSDLYLKKKMRW